MAVTQRMMKIQLNGKAHELSAVMPLSDFLASIGLGGKPVVVELNEAPVFARDYPVTQIEDGSRVEIVVLAAGG